MRRLWIRGRRWKVAISRLPIYKKDATCDYTNRIILISPSTKDKKSALIHEIIHACLPDLEELAVCEIELALQDGINILDRL